MQNAARQKVMKPVSSKIAVLERLAKALTRPSLSFASIVIALAAAIFTGLQWWEDKQGAETAQIQAKAALRTADAAAKQAEAAQAQISLLAQSAALAGASVDAARDGIDASKAAEQRQGRAYVTLADGAVSGWAVGERPQFTVNFINGGRTPAYKLRSYITVALHTEQVVMSLPKPLGPASERVLGVGTQQTVVSRFSEPISQELFDAVKDGRQVVLIGAVVDYEDIYGMPHATIIRLYFNGDVEAGMLILPDGNFSN